MQKDIRELLYFQTIENARIFYCLGSAAEMNRSEFLFSSPINSP
jgi:hypothetical protein